MSFVPHFDLPFRFIGARAATVEQDTLDDITNCVVAILRTIEGQRLEINEFGIPDPTFGLQPLRLDALISKVIELEPRAAIMISQAPDRFDSLVADIVAQVSAQEVNG